MHNNVNRIVFFIIITLSDSEIRCIHANLMSYDFLRGTVIYLCIILV